MRGKDAVVTKERQRARIGIGVNRSPGVGVDLDDARAISAARIEARRWRPQHRPSLSTESSRINVGERVPNLNSELLGVEKRAVFGEMDPQPEERSLRDRDDDHRKTDDC